MTAAVITGAPHRAGRSSAASPPFLTAAQAIGQPFPLLTQLDHFGEMAGPKAPPSPEGEGLGAGEA